MKLTCNVKTSFPEPLRFLLKDCAKGKITIPLVLVFAFLRLIVSEASPIFFPLHIVSVIVFAGALSAAPISTFQALFLFFTAHVILEFSSPSDIIWTVLIAYGFYVVIGLFIFVPFSAYVHESFKKLIDYILDPKRPSNEASSHNSESAETNIYLGILAHLAVTIVLFLILTQVPPPYQVRIPHTLFIVIRHILAMAMVYKAWRAINLLLFGR